MQIRSGIFDIFDPVFILSYLSAFKLAHDTHGVGEGAAPCLLHFFVTRLAAAALDARIIFKSKSDKREEEGTVTSFSDFVTYLLETYRNDDIIPETDTDVM